MNFYGFLMFFYIIFLLLWILLVLFNFFYLLKMLRCCIKIFLFWLCYIFFIDLCWGFLGIFFGDV